MFRSPLAPLLVGLLAVAGTVVLWRALEQREAHMRDEILAGRAISARTEIEARVRASMLALVRMASRWAMQGRFARSQWLPDAELYVLHDPAYRAIVWVDVDWSPSAWVERHQSQHIVTGTPPADLTWIGRALRECRSGLIAQVLCRPGEESHNDRILVITPVTREQGAIGFVVGIFDIRTLLGESLKAHVLPGYAIAVDDGVSTVFRRGGVDDDLARSTGRATAIPLQIPGLDWRVLVWPAPGTAAYSPSLLPRMVIGGGLLISVLLGALTWFSQAARQRAADLARVNAQIEGQMQALEAVQLGLRQRETILKAVSIATEHLLRARVPEEAIPGMLRHLGNAVAVSRIRVFENEIGADGGLTTWQRFAWCTPGGGVREAGAPAWEKEVIERWRGALNRGQAVIDCSPVSGSRDEVARERPVSVLVIPIFVDTQWWGFIQFEEDGGVREWTEPEINALKVAASVVGAAIAHVRAGRRLRESEERFRQLAENIHEVFWMLDPRTERLLYASPAYSDLSGRAVGELYDNFWSFFDIVHAEDRERVSSLVKASVRSGMPFEVDFRVIRRDGATRWARCRGFPVRDEQGRVLRIAGVAEDVTERRHAEEARIALAERQRDTLVREVHHRIKNNLQGVIGLLRQNVKAHPELREALESSIAQVNAVATIHGLQSRASQGELRLRDLVAAIADATAGMRSAPLPIGVQLDGAGELMIVDTEAVPIALIVNELVLNAVKHATAGARDGRIQISFEPLAQGGVLRITNPAERLPENFDFGAGRGLGTGLGLVRSLMPSRGAALTIDINDGRVETVLTLLSPVVAKVHRELVCS